MPDTENLTINQRVAEHAAKRLGEYMTECCRYIEAFRDKIKQQSLHEAIRWRGDIALEAEWAMGVLRQALVAMGELHRGDYDNDAIRVLGKHRSNVEQILLHGPDPLALSSGSLCTAAARLSEIAGNRRAYKALTTVYQELRGVAAELRDAAR